MDNILTRIDKPQKRGHVYACLFFLSKKEKRRNMKNMNELFETNGSSLTILVPTELDHHNAEMIRKGADRIIANQLITRLIFDFSNTSFMDSSGIGAIMGRYKNIRLMGGSVSAIQVSKRVHKILTLSGIHKLIEIKECV
jgi:anti-anti-sigma factor